MRKWIGVLVVLIVFAGLQIACTSQQDASIAEMATVQADQATQIAQQNEVIENLSLTVAAGNTGDLSDSATPEPVGESPVVGEVTIEDDVCCASGVVGETIQLTIQFEAMSPTGLVTQMRYITGDSIADNQEIYNAEWQDYDEEIVVDVEIAYLNWDSYWVTVQYMDEGDYLSPIYVDDISIEGFAVAPTETP